MRQDEEDPMENIVSVENTGNQMPLHEISGGHSYELTRGKSSLFR